MSAKLFPLPLRKLLTDIGDGRGTPARHWGNRPRRLMLEWGLGDLVDGVDGDELVLTPTGRAVQELVLEIQSRDAQIERMQATGLNLAIPRPEPRPIRKAPAELTCGRLNHDSFATFIASLNGAGLNRWRDPGFTGDAPVRAAPQPAHKEEDDGKTRS